MTMPSLPSPAAPASIGTVWPVRVRAATAENCRVETQRCASTRAVFTGLPASAAIVMVRSSSRSRDQLGGAVEHRGALVGRKSAGVEGGARGLDGLADERGVALGTRPIRVPS